jgi:choline dehydrogenase-like flavoprotein
VSVPNGLIGQAEVTGDLSLECGTVIVGSGAGGATVAAELAEAGVDVIVLEEGGYHPTESFTAGTGRALRTLYRDGGGRMAIGRDSELFKGGAEASGWTVVPNRRNQLHCAGTNSCTSGCPTGAKRSMLVTSVPRALSLGARLFADCRVDRVTRSGPGVTGVTGHFVRPGGRKGPSLTVRARTVIVAGGAVQTPALLLRSGLRSASGQLGRRLSVHPNAPGTARCASVVAAPPVLGRASSTSVRAPERARYAAATRPLCPPPTMTAS